MAGRCFEESPVEAQGSARSTAEAETDAGGVVGQGDRFLAEEAQRCRTAEVLGMPVPLRGGDPIRSAIEKVAKKLAILMKMVKNDDDDDDDDDVDDDEDEDDKKKRVWSIKRRSKTIIVFIMSGGVVGY